MGEKKNIREFNLSQIKDEIVVLGEKPFRAKQIYEWLWQKDAASFQEMTSLSVSLRQLLEENFHD